MGPATGENDCGVAQVVPLLKIRHLGDRIFDYAVPDDLADQISVGSLVAVPFGSRGARAVVVGMSHASGEALGALRPVEAVDGLRVSEELLQLACAMAARYLASYESCLRLVVPPIGHAGRKRVAIADAWLFRSDQVADVREECADDQQPRPEKVSGKRSSPTSKQALLLAAIPESGIPSGAACAEAGVGKTVLKGLLQKGLAELGREPTGASASRTVTSAARVMDVPRLSAEQGPVVRDLVAAYEAAGLASRLLWGVTGSGKTEVYLRLVAHALEDAAGVILLVPEIALTPQMIERVRARFGDRVGVLHSGLTPAERRREYGRVAAGEATVVVGARSAVFAPVASLRLVIIDESHDASYKQEEEPRYHVKTVAELRLRRHGGLLLEGSATPAVESAVKVDECLRLTRRAVGSVSECEVVDMRHQGSGGVLAPATREALAQTLRQGEQAIVLLNRRGFAGHVHCDSCGHVMMCDDCELSLTYHGQARRLICHHCGRSYSQPSLCPNCKEAPLGHGAPGTERLEGELHKLVPQGQVFRLDSDTLTSGTRVGAVLEEFCASRPAVLLGTQMVAKGHDFPHVTLVVVADADTALYVPDFRAAERTFQLLTQVSGRAGRADRPGRVVVQTWNPDVPCIRMALDRDAKGFYRRELAIRERLGYPPFTELVRLVTVGGQAQRAQLGAQHLAERLSSHFTARELRGPSRLPSLRGKERWHLLVAAEDGQRARAVVGQAMAQLREPYRKRGVALLVDVDPVSFG